MKFRTAATLQFTTERQIRAALKIGTYRQIQAIAKRLHVGCYMPKGDSRTRENLISWIGVMLRVKASERMERLERLTCRELRQLLKGTKGCTTAIRAGKAAMVAFAAEHGLNPDAVLFA